jgi:hypothetical protein
MDKLLCKTQLSNLGSGETPIFMLKPENVVEMTESEFLTTFARILGWSTAKARFALDAYGQAILDALSANKYVQAGPFNAKLAVKGSLQSMTEQPNKINNPVVANITAAGALKDALSLIEVVNNSEVVAAAIYEVMQAGASGVNRIESADGVITITGTGLMLDLNAADEGVWLADKNTGAVVKNADVSYSDHGVIRCAFNAASFPEDGQYRLVVATRDGDATKSVRTVTRLVQVSLDA